MLNVIAHYSLLVLALFGIKLFFPYGLDIPADIAIIALFIFRFRKKFLVVRLPQTSQSANN